MREYVIGSGVRLERNLPRSLIDRFIAGGRNRRLARGERLFAQGDPAEHVFLLLEGRIKVAFTGQGGSVSLLRVHLRHSLVGLSALRTVPVRDASAVAMDPVSVAVMGREGFAALMAAGGEGVVALVTLLINRLTDMHYRIGELLEQPVEQRLAAALLALSTPDPEAPADAGSLGIPLNQEELAQLVNSRRPTISTILGRFGEAGYLGRDGRVLRVEDVDGLRRLARGAG